MIHFIRRPLPLTRSFCSALTRSDSESWRSLDGVVRCSANDVPLSPLRFLERSSKAYSDDTSLIYDSLSFTWAQTHDRCLKLASSLAHHLRISRGDVVATFSYNQPEMYELHFAVPMAGAILCTLNARQDANMVSALLRHSQAKALFVEPELLDIARAALDLLSTAPPALVLLGPAPPPAHEPKTFHYETLVRNGNNGFEIRHPLSEWDPISINYTSGTTSRPKAVVYSHRGAYLNSLATVLLHNMAARSVYLWTVPMFHCNGWCLPWGTAAQGAKSVCIRKPTAKAIFDSIALHGVTHMGGVPTLLSSIVNSRPEDRRPLTRGGVEVLTGGSAPAPRVLAEMEAMGFQVNHIYGLTETLGAATNCVRKTEWDVLGPEERYKMKAKQGVAHLGMAEVDVWDPQTMSPVEADGRTMGEVVFRGNTVMSGYFKDQHATEEAFKGGWFWTGDLAVKHHDSYIEIKDRAKDVVISGGENISTMEVEAVLYSHDAVLEAAVVGLPDPHWGETPCAFVDLKEGFEDTVRGDDIIEFCRARLPGYMVPRRVIFGELPKNSTGKIQKFVLRALAKGGI